MADQISTRFGVLGRDVFVAVRETLALTVSDGLAALDEAYRQLGLSHTDDDADTTLPSDRWNDLLRDLFPNADIFVTRAAVPTTQVSDLVTSPEDERVIQRLLATAASFLLAESATLEDQLELWKQLANRQDGELDRVRAVMRYAFDTGHALLDHAEQQSWRALPAAVTRPHGADAVSDDQHHASSVTERRIRIAVLSRRSDLQNFETTVLDVLARLASDALQEPTDTVQLIECSPGRADPEGATPLPRRLLACTPGRLSIRYAVTEDARHEAVDTPARSGHTPSDLDLLNALSILTRSEKPDLVVLVSSGVQPAPSSVLASCLDARGMLPLLKDTTVVLTGHTSDGTANYWSSVCSAAGARPLVVSTGPPRHSDTVRHFSRRDTRPDAGSAFLNVVGTWGSTARAAVMVLALTAGMVATIVALGVTGKDSLGWLAGITAVLVSGRFGIPMVTHAVRRRRDRSWWTASGFRATRSPDTDPIH